MKKRKIVIIAVVLIIAIFAITINALFSMRDSKEEENTVVAETLDKDDATPATISSTKEENYQKQVNDLSAQIDSLKRSIDELTKENSSLRNENASLQEENNSLKASTSTKEESLEEFLDSFFVPDSDGKKYRLRETVTLFTNKECTGEPVDSSNLIFLQDGKLQFPANKNGTVPFLVYDQNKNIYFTLQVPSYLQYEEDE